ncbi:MAG: Isopentenyl-diphosphate delta-isomerase [ANME-2 cluster archaeon]|nr:Isopentenyl-diphosphate delta-isomerase [ANME-2 cluster archaeon]
MTTSLRKIEHLQICANDPVEAHVSAGFDDVHLIHCALPEIDKDEIDTSTELFGKVMAAPLLIASMTGGHPDTYPINKALALAAEHLGIGIGVGSQRAALENPEQEETFRVVRDCAPHAFVYANIGVVQLTEYGIDGVEHAIEMIDADAIAIHLNFLQEAIQPEGCTHARGSLDAIKDVCDAVSVPVIAKETGAGISREVAAMLAAAGVDAIDVGGAGGTSWAGVEYYRALDRGDLISEHLGGLFWDWGIPTAASVVECASCGLPVIATGGVRTGIDIAKSIALGASLSGTALPLVAPAMKNADAVIDRLSRMISELEIAMFLCGCPDVAGLKTAPAVIGGRIREMLDARGF